MDPDEAELLNDYRYRSYATVIDKALRNFESSSEWADLISSLGKLNKALQSNLRFSLLPKRLIIGKRLAQCLHPALPSGVHLKALETYEVIFKIIGTKWLAKDLFIYSSGLFPLLAHAAMAVKPALLTLYERYFLPLQKALLPCLQAFITGLLPGLEEGLEIYDRTDALLVKLSLLIGQEVFYGTLWSSMVITPMIRLPATTFIVAHFNRTAPLSQQAHVLGYGHNALLKPVCLALQDNNVLVQRNMLEILIYFFPFASHHEPAQSSAPLADDDMSLLVSAALLTLLRRDMSLNRRLYAWLLGTDIKGGMVAPHPVHSGTIKSHTSFYFSHFSKTYLVKGMINLLELREVGPSPESAMRYLRPFRILTILLDKQDIGHVVLSYVLLEVVRTFRNFCRETVKEDKHLNLSNDQLLVKIKENKAASEIIKTMNMLVRSMTSEYLWEYMTHYFRSVLRKKENPPSHPEQKGSRSSPTVKEISELIMFLLEVLPLELHPDIQSFLLPDMLGIMLRALRRNIESACLENVTHGLRVCFKVMSKIQMPMEYDELDTEAHSLEDAGPPEDEEEGKNIQDLGKEQGKVVIIAEPKEKEGELPAAAEGEVATATGEEILAITEEWASPSLKEEVSLSLEEEVTASLKEKASTATEGLDPAAPEGEVCSSQEEGALAAAEGEVPAAADGEVPAAAEGEVPAAAEEEILSTQQEEVLVEKEVPVAVEAEAPGDVEEEVPVSVEEKTPVAEEEEVSAEPDIEQTVPVTTAGDEADTNYSTIRSEDSGLGVSASPSDQQLLLDGMQDNGKENGKSEDAWRKGGSVDTMSQCLQEILAHINTRYLLVQVEDVQGSEKQPDQSPTSPVRKSILNGREIREMLVELFTPNRLKAAAAESRDSPAPIEKKKEREGSGDTDWAAGFMPRGKAEISESCRQSFIATCHLMLECTTFPVYYTEQETLALYAEMFGQTDADVGALPVWLRSLMILCCLSRDSHVQHTAVASLLELINHSQSLALVIQDKHTRYQNSDTNPLTGRLQMVTLPPIFPAVLRALEDTDFYQRVALVLWNQLDTERREHHVSCVDLFYRLHCLAPSTSICEDIVCRALHHKDTAVRLEALYRFTVLWHLTREVQANRTMSLSRSFDRSLCVVVDSLGSADGSMSAAAQCWLVRALSLNDVARILEPILLLLLHPSTQRHSIHSVKQSFTANDINILRSKSLSTARNAEAAYISAFSTLNYVDREALWAELEGGSEPTNQAETLIRSESEETEGDVDKTDEADSEHTESADTSGAQVSTENSSSGSGPFSSEDGAVVNGLRRMGSERTQTSESLSSEEDELELEEIARSRLLRQERERREAIDSLFRHVLLYRAAGGWRHLLQGLDLLESLFRSSAESPLVDALCSSSLETSSAAHLNLVSNLLQRHRQAEEGKGFYGTLLSPPPSPSAKPTLLLNLVVSLCLRFLRSYYPPYLGVTPLDLQGNREVQVKSVTVLIRVVNQLCDTARDRKGSSLDSINKLLSTCKLQQYVLLSLSASMYVIQRGTGKESARKLDQLDEQGHPTEESLVNMGTGGGQDLYPLQIELLKLLHALIVLEFLVWPAAGVVGGSVPEAPVIYTPLAREWQTAVLYQQSIRAAQYIHNRPITTQGMFVSAAARALQPQYGYAMHPHWVALLCSSLPYLGRSLGIIVAPFISQVCSNLDDLVKLYEHDGGKTNQSFSGKRENIAPDYPLTLLEGLTAITHYCILDNKKSLVPGDPVDARNARNAAIEALTNMLSSITSLWSIVLKEEDKRRKPDSTESSKHTSSSVYFKNTKILRQRILEFLRPLTGPQGVQLMASLGVVWSHRRGKRKHRNQVLPVTSESRLIIVDLVKSMTTLNTEGVLNLVKEVVKKPHQLKGEQKSKLVDIPMLQFSYTYIQKIPVQALQENLTPLLNLLRESIQLNLAPPGLFLLLGILHDLVNKLPNLDNKKDSKDLQDVTQRILEAVGGVVGSSLEQTSWLSRSLEVKVQSQVCQEEEESDDHPLVDGEGSGPSGTMVSSSAPSIYSVQALILLAEILAPLLDMVYQSDEKEKAVPLITRLMYYVFPYLKNHNGYNMPSFEAGAQLLSSLSGYAYTKRAWKKEVFELFMDPLFFTMNSSCAQSWKSIIDHLLTHEKTMFKDLMSMQSSSLKLIASSEQKPMLLKRQAFAVFSGELDQYHLYLPLIQERLTETLRSNPTPAILAQMFLMFRVLLLRISSQHLTSLWPIMITELVRNFTQLEKALQPEKDVSKLTKVLRGVLDRGGPVNFPQVELDMFLSACKFLDTSLAFPPGKLPLFQMYRWAFVPEVDETRYSGPETTVMEGEEGCMPHVVRILERVELRHGASFGLSEESSTETLEFPLITQRSLSSIAQLLPFLRTVCCTFKGPPSACQVSSYNPVADYPAANSMTVMKRLELIIEEEFLDLMDN